MSGDWVVKKAAKSLVPGDKFIFDPEFGGEGEVVTVTGAGKWFGSVGVNTVEVDFELAFTAETMLTMVTGDE
jgi:hypothetical protein